ncbi:MAG TPA: extracellular solute-binding protein [Candidatus Acidoferrales bacterium]|nr:extracellular solute-binding protein [Candidatus Acidoferrales bacterium]
MHFHAWMRFLAFTALAFAPLSGAASAAAPGNLANDPVAKLLGMEVMNAALKEGRVVWYAGDNVGEFFKAGGKEAFEKRFGIRLEPVTGRLREQTDKVRAEHATGRKIADVFDGVVQYLMELYKAGALEKFKNPAPALAEFDRSVFVQEPADFWTPLFISAQALIVNTNLVKKEEYPKSYWDIVNPKWKGRVATRDPRSAGGGGWQFLQFYNHPKLGLEYIRKLKEVVEPFTVPGGSREMRDAVLLGQFPLGFSGRPEFLTDVPKGSPLAYVVPQEGLTWLPHVTALLKGSPHPNAGKVALTWFYEIQNLQLLAKEGGRMIPHPKIKMPIPEMEIGNYTMMPAIPSQQLADPGFFFKEMEKIFGRR